MMVMVMMMTLMTMMRILLIITISMMPTPHLFCACEVKWDQGKPVDRVDAVGEEDEPGSRKLHHLMKAYLKSLTEQQHLFHA